MTALSRFSTSYTAHEMLFLYFRASLSSLASSRPICLFLRPVIHYSYRLGLMVLLSTLSILCCPCYWAFFLTNDPQQQESMNFDLHDWKNKVYLKITMIL